MRAPAVQSARGVTEDNNRCPSPLLFNLFLEKLMQETLHDHNTSVSIGGRPICNLRFADDIYPLGGSNGKVKDLRNRLVVRRTAYGMEVSTENSNL